MEDKQSRFVDAVARAIEEQIVPKLFTPVEQAEMNLPWHRKSDHYYAMPVITTEPEYGAHFGVKPQLALHDPRISAERINAAPRTIQISFEGLMHEIPLRVYRSRPDEEVVWKDDLEFLYRGRAASAELDISLAKEFNLKSGHDYSIGNGIGVVNGKKAVSLLVQLMTDRAQKRSPEIQHFVEERVTRLVPDRASKVKMSGPVLLE